VITDHARIRCPGAHGVVTAKEEGSSRRVLARAKSNIAPDDGGLAYSLDLVTIGGDIAAMRAMWDGVIEGTAREILGDVERDDRDDGTSQGDLQQLLVDMLTENGGKMPAKLVKA
jgi:putative DNA primase/helicase